MDLQIENSELQKSAPQILTKFARKLGFLTKKNYFEVQQLYHLVARDWKETFQILQTLLGPEQWRELYSVFEEWLFVEVAHKNKFITRQQGDYCIHQKIESVKQKKKYSRLVLEEENFLNSQQVQKIQRGLRKADLIPEDPKPAVEQREDLSVDKVEFGRYKILKELGQGGMGKVYQAYDTELKRTVALKILLSLGQHTNNPKRFFREAQLMGKLRHPNIVKIYDIGEWKEGTQTTYFFTMEWIDGAPLDRLLPKHSFTLHQAAELVRKVAIALAYAHKQGIIHRDIKPSNILVDQEGEPWLMDFGLAKILKGEEKISKTGSVLGTPVYMAPEQAGGKIHQISELTDIYSLGTLFYEMLTGVPPFRGDSSLAIVLQVIHSDPLPPRKINRSIPIDLESICLKAMDKVPYRRYASGLALAEDLHRFLRGLPVEATPLTIFDVLWRKIQRNKAAVCLVTALLLAVLATVCYWSYREYRLLKDLQNCMKRVLGLQEIATKNPAEREQLLREHIKDFDLHIENNSRNAAAYLGRGLCYIMLGNYEESYSDLTATIALGEYSPLPISQLYLMRAVYSLEFAHYREALSDLKKANVPDSELWLGKIYSDFGRYDQALEIFDKIMTEVTHSSGSSKYSWESFLLANAFKADLLSRRGDHKTALEHSQMAINSIPNLGGSIFISVNASTAYTVHAIVLSRAKRYEEAYDSFCIAFQWLSINEMVYSQLGKMYAQQGDFAQAWQMHEEASQCSTQAHITYYNIACYYALQSNYQKALENLELAFQKGYRDFTWLQMDPDMKELAETPQVKEMLKEYSDSMPN